MPENIKYSDFFINLKQIPSKGSEARKALREQERERCLGGVYVDGVFISGWLYWHMNHWWITDDKKDEYDNIIPWERVASLRDNEWIRAEALEKCRTFKNPDGTSSLKGYIEVGLRQGAKTTTESSFTGYNATLFRKSQNVVVSGSEDDLNNIKLRLNYGLSKLWDGLKIPKLTKDKRAKEVSLGYKATDGDDIIWSHIIVRNIAEGQNTEGPAGLSAKSFIMDEIGKALKKDSILYTTNKEITIENCKIGDKIYDETGNLTTILDKFDSGIIDLFEIELQDGRKINASGDHLWKVFNTKNQKYEIKNTNDLLSKYYYNKFDKRYNKTIKSFLYSIPNTSSIKYPEKDLEIDPYYLGLWLGDGESKKPQSLCSIDDFIINYCEEYGNTLNLKSTITYFKNKNPKFRKITLAKTKGSTNILQEIFRELNLINNKHIPEQYLKSSYRQRLELLQGLMDTDGSCDKKGKITFSTSVPQLAKDFETLCRSLGISIYGKKVPTHYTIGRVRTKCKDTYKFSLYTGIKVFKLQRKVDNYYLSRRNGNSKKQKAYKERCTIVNITPIEKDHAYCIKVNNDSGLFLTDNYTVTHNSPFSQALEAAKPALMSKYGWRAIPLLVGTGGSFEKGEDAERIFYHPEANNFLPFKDPDTGEITGLFMSGLYRTDCKELTNLACYLIQSGRIPEGSYPELSKIPIDVSNKEKALKKILEERALKALDPDQTEYLKLKMYFPLTPKECFLSTSENFYNKELVEKQKDRLEQEFPGLKIGMYLELEETQEGNDVVIKHKTSELLPISSFPLKHTENQNTPIVILEHPIPNAPYGLYTAGIDPYRHDKAPNSESLGAVYIFKRAYDVLSDTFQDMPVAWYVGRPDKRSMWDNKARLLIKYYNAIALCENDELSFIDYMISKGDDNYLMDTPDWAKTLVPNSSSLSRAKGVSSAAPKIKLLLRTNLKAYMEEVSACVPQPGTTETKKVLGVSKINDPCFLDEISKWNENGNYDREIALSLAITCAKKLDQAKIIPKVQEEDPRFVYKPKSYKPSPFKETTTLDNYKPQINKLFR